MRPTNPEFGTFTILGVATKPERACDWCGLRVSRHEVNATPTCTECKTGGRPFRVRMALQRWQRGKERR